MGYMHVRVCKNHGHLGILQTSRTTRRTVPAASAVKRRPASVGSTVAARILDGSLIGFPDAFFDFADLRADSARESLKICQYNASREAVMPCKW